MVVIGPLPPPEKVSADGTAVGVMLPSMLTCSVASVLRQVPSAFRTRSATVLESVVSVPSGLAVVRLPAVVSASMTTGFPELFARAEAAATDADRAS
ncbi:hypothetical protein [Kitasatospora sp. NPDC047058]|uniref:hypothetical protein n=1 Tax=Kitasatospora sp. NPDC047058 TaxID=3155620 RepID=UPI0033E72CF6